MFTVRYLSEYGEYIYGELEGINEDSVYEHLVIIDGYCLSIVTDLLEIEVEPDVWMNLQDAIDEGILD